MKIHYKQYIGVKMKDNNKINICTQKMKFPRYVPFNGGVKIKAAFLGTLLY